MHLIHRITGTAVFMAVALFTHAQTKTDQAEVTWGPELDLKKDGYLMSVVDNTDDAIYRLVQVKKDLHMVKTTLDQRELYNKPLDLELDKKELRFEGIHLVGEKLVQFASFYDKKAEENVLYMMTYSEADLRPVGRMERIASVDAEKSRNRGGFSLYSSPDRSKVLLEVEKPRAKNGDETFLVKVFDADMNEQWSQDVRLPYADNEFMRERLYVDNDGSVLVQGVKYTKKTERRERKRADEATYDYHILVYHAGGGAPDDYTISSPSRFLQDMVIALDDKAGDIICAGFYSDINTIGIKGPYYLTFDRATKQIAHESYGVFDKEFITMYMTEKEEKKESKRAEKKDKDLGIRWDYDLKEIVFKEDGGAVLVAEQYYMYVTTVCSSTPNGGRTCTTYYHYLYNDIIAVDVNGAGDIQWSAKVPKRQHSINDGGMYSSYALEVKDDKMYFIFNDNGANLFLKPGDKVEQFKLNNKNSLVTIATVDGDGHVKREALFTPEKRESILRPKDCVQLQDDRMLIYATFKKKARYGSILFR